MNLLDLRCVQLRLVFLPPKGKNLAAEAEQLPTNLLLRTACSTYTCTSLASLQNNYFTQAQLGLVNRQCYSEQDLHVRNSLDLFLAYDFESSSPL